LSINDLVLLLEPSATSSLSLKSIGIWQEPLRDLLLDEAENQGQRTQENAVEMLLERQRAATHRSADVLDEEVLQHESEGHYHPEEGVVPRVRKGVEFIPLEYSCVDEVEHLEEHKDVKEESVVDELSFGV
jgi:hypothetical protein